MTELPEHQVKAAGKAFEQEFERFARFTGDPAALSGLDFETAVAEAGLLSSLRHNLNHGIRDVRLFEIGRHL